MQVDDLKKRLALAARILVAQWKFSSTPYETTAIRNLQTYVSSLEAQHTTSADLLNLKELLYEFDIKNSSWSIEKYNEWKKKTARATIALLEKLGHKPEKFGPFKFSEAFPITFNWLKGYVPLRWPERANPSIPDPSVSIMAGEVKEYVESRINEQARTVGTELLGSISLNLTNLLPHINIENESDLKKVLKYLDTQPRFQSVLVHEYEHILQGVFRKTKIRKDVGYSTAAEFFEMPLLKPISKLIAAFSQKHRELALKLKIYPNRSELEATLAEMVFQIAKRYRLENIEGGYLPYMIFEQLESHIASLTEGLPEQEKLLQEAKAKNAPKQEINQIKKNISTIKDRLVRAQQFKHDLNILTEEAQTIGLQLKEN